MAREATLKEMRRITDHNQSFNSTDTAIGDSVLLYEKISRKGIPEWRGPAKILGVDETGGTVKFRGETFKIARYCVRERVISVSATPSGARDWEEQGPPHQRSRIDGRGSETDGMRVDTARRNGFREATAQLGAQ